MIKKTTRYLVMLVFFISMCFCADAGDLKTTPNNKGDEKSTVKRLAAGQITAFKIPQQIAPEVIDETNHLIGLVVHANTPLTALTPTISYVGSTITPNSGIPQDFTNAVGYVVDGSAFYSVNVLHARSPSPICNGTSTTIAGDPPPVIPGTFGWEILNAANNWIPAPGIKTNPDYTTATLTSNLNTPKLYTFRRSITNALGVAYDSYNDLIVNPKTAIAGNHITVPTTIVFCAAGDAAIITGDPATGGDGVNYNYQWQRSTNGGSVFTDIPGATAADYDPPAATITTIYQRTVSSGACNPPSVSNKVTITVLSGIANNHLFDPATSFFCNRSIPAIINGNIPGGGAGTIQYQWQSSLNGIDFVDIPLNSFSRNDYNVPVLTQTTYYRRGATSGACTIPVYSNIITMTIQQGLSNNSITAPDCAVGGGSVITGTAAAGGTGSYNYQWQSSPDGGAYTNIPGPGAKNQDYILPVATGEVYYQRLVTSGACAIPLVSNQVHVIVNSTLAGNTITAPAIINFCASGNPGPIAGALPTGGGGSYTYVWQNSVNGGPFIDILNSNVQNFDPQTVAQTTVYRRGVISNACNTPAFSNTVTITIQPELGNNTIQSPAIVNFCESGSPGTITGSAPTGGTGTYTYVWQSSVNGSPFTDISGSNVQNYNPQAVTQTTRYQRSITSGTCTTPLVSNPVTITVAPAITSNVINQPPNAVYCVTSNPVTITTQPPTGGDGTYTYQWTSSADNLTYNPITGATNADYTVPALTTTTWFKRVVSSGECLNTSQSNPVVITVHPALSNNILTPPPVISFCQAGNAGPITGTIPSGGDASYTYQWQQSSTGTAASFTDIGGQTGANFDPPNLTSTMFYRRVVLNSACNTPLISNVIEIQILTIPLTITAQGASVCPGEIATLTTNNSDIDVAINWYTSPTGGTSIFTGNSFTTLPVNANATYYAEAANNNCVSATRSIAKVQLLQTLPTPVVSVESAIAPDVTFKWAAVADATGYQVSIDNGQTFTDPSSGSNGTTHTVTGLQVGQSVTIIVRATGNESCQLSNNSTPVIGTIADLSTDEIFVANAFTPNGDGKNDRVYVRNENIKSLKFYVYDQWGEMLYVSLSRQNGWDGTFKGKTEPAGIYVYYLEAIMNNGKQVKKKGTITLLR